MVRLTNTGPKGKINVVDWAQAQQEDPELEIAIRWIKSDRTSLLRTDLSELADTKDGLALISRQKHLVIINDKLYVRATPPSNATETKLFIIPRAYRRKAIDGCHLDAGHQGQNCTLSLAAERFWWPNMPSEVRNAIKNCHKCIKHEFNTTKEPLHPIITMAPLDLVHIDFTSIEVSRDDDLHTTPMVVPVLVITDHFTRHLMAFVTKDQKGSTITRKLYENYICIFGAPAQIHSDRGANFTSMVITELCSLLGIQKSKTTPYCPQSNGKVERMHQTLIQMIGKLPEQKKINWPAHLPEVLQAYNGTQSAIMGYSPHYLMFGQIPRFPINLYFPTLRGEMEKFHVNHYVADIQKHLEQPLEVAQKHNKYEAL